MLSKYKKTICSPLFTEGPVVVFLWRNETGWPVETVTKNVERILGYSEKDFLEKQITFDALIHPDDLKLILNEVKNFLFSSFEFIDHTSYRLKKVDGTFIWVKDFTVKVSQDGEITHLIGYIYDISKEKYLQQKMQKYINIINKNVIVSSTDLSGKITSASNAFLDISQYSEEELIGSNHNLIRHPDMKKEFFQDLWATITQEKVWKGEIKNLSKYKQTYWVDTTISPTYDHFGKHIGYTSVRQDITDKKRVEELSIKDALTNVYNRLKLDSVLLYELAQSKRYNTNLSVIIVDIDDFKQVNDTYGHQVGDDVLKEMSKLLRKNCRQSDTLGRWGGEEFLIILSKTDLNEACIVAGKLQLIIEEYIFVHIGHKTCSFGVSSLRENDNEVRLIERADQALYQAKALGKNRVQEEL